MEDSDSTFYNRLDEFNLTSLEKAEMALIYSEALDQTTSISAYLTDMVASLTARQSEALFLSLIVMTLFLMGLAGCLSSILFFK